VCREGLEQALAPGTHDERYHAGNRKYGPTRAMNRAKTKRDKSQTERAPHVPARQAIHERHQLIHRPFSFSRGFGNARSVTVPRYFDGLAASSISPTPVWYQGLIDLRTIIMSFRALPQESSAVLCGSVGRWARSWRSHARDFCAKRLRAGQEYIREPVVTFVMSIDGLWPYPSWGPGAHDHSDRWRLPLPG
jgi:hypothetical protein